jgi:hypothetical protein
VASPLRNPQKGRILLFYFSEVRNYMVEIIIIWYIILFVLALAVDFMDCTDIEIVK